MVCKNRSRIARQIIESEAMERRSASTSRFEERCVRHAKSGKQSDGWKGQVGQDSNPTPWEEDKYKLTREEQCQMTGQDFKNRNSGNTPHIKHRF